MKKIFTLVAMACMAFGANAQTYTVAEETKEIDNTIFDEIVAAAADNAVEVVLPAGAEIKVALTDKEGNAKTMVLPDGLSIKFTGASADSKSTLSWTKSLLFDGTHGYVSFENVILTDAGCQYLFNQAKEASVDEITFASCEIKDFERSVVRTQGEENITIKSLVVDNCIGTNLAYKNGYSIFYFGTATTAVGKVEMKNSTFDTTQRSFIEASKAPVENGISISDCTFYNNVVDGRYLIDANGQNTEITLDKVILGKTFHAEKSKGIRTAATITVKDCIRTSDCIYASNDIKELPAGEKTSAEIFTDPEKHDFTLLIDDKVGDPRWYKASSGDDGDGISNITATENVNAPAYNLAGQRVNANAKGLVIKNGKKFMNK